MVSRYKKKIFIGILMTTTAFLIMVGVFSYIFNREMSSMDEARDLQTRVNLLQSEKQIAFDKIAELEAGSGKFIEVDKVVEKSKKYYDEAERTRKEGRLWIDRKSNSLIVTLGMVNGVTAGHRLTIFDNRDQVGTVKVINPLDVISYVEPVNKQLSEFKKDYYRVVLEK